MTTITEPATAFTHIATIGQNRNVPVRWDGHHWWSRYQVNYAIVHPARTVSDVRPVVASGETENPK